MALAFAQGEEVCDRIAFEVDAAFLRLDDARQRLVLARTDLEQARENLRVVRKQYDAGDATPTDIVDAELALVRGQENLATATYDDQVAAAGLAYAVGLSPKSLTANASSCPPSAGPSPREP